MSSSSRAINSQSVQDTYIAYSEEREVLGYKAMATFLLSTYSNIPGIIRVVRGIFSFDVGNIEHIAGIPTEQNPNWLFVRFNQINASHSTLFFDFYLISPTLNWVFHTKSSPLH